jgi:hypothetical protein
MYAVPLSRNQSQHLGAVLAIWGKRQKRKSSVDCEARNSQAR